MTPRPWRARAYGAGALLGVAAMAAVDEIVFHQLLGWHHFYDDATADIGILSDGILHTLELFAFAAGFFLMLDARRRPDFRAVHGWAGFLVGLGAFQLWDGIVDHKLLRLHQIRYGVDVVPYDVAWNVAGAALLAAGLVLTLRLRRAARPAAGGRRTPRA